MKEEEGNDADRGKPLAMCRKHKEQIGRQLKAKGKKKARNLESAQLVQRFVALSLLVLMLEDIAADLV